MSKKRGKNKLEFKFEATDNTDNNIARHNKLKSILNFFERWSSYSNKQNENVIEINNKLDGNINISIDSSKL